MLCSGFTRLDAELAFVLSVKVHMNVMRRVKRLVSFSVGDSIVSCPQKTTAIKSTCEDTSLSAIENSLSMHCVHTAGSCTK